jgi:acetyltransferase-like isoleucine patch superfamily enzyme
MVMAYLSARPHGFVFDVRRALTSPGQVRQVLSAQFQLRGCDAVPFGVRLRGRVFVENHGEIRLGEKVRIDGRTVPVEMVAHQGARLTVGARTYLNYGVSLSAHQEVTIGENCLIGNYVNVLDSDYHDLRDRSKPGESAPVIIEDDVWLATRTLVLKGVRIGKGAVVGAGSVVTSDIPAGTLAFGVPARVIREL